MACNSGRAGATTARPAFNTFSERMAEHPVRVIVLRFRSKAQQVNTVTLENGAVDIVIGTHRLIQPDVKFKDLGWW